MVSRRFFGEGISRTHLACIVDASRSVIRFAWQSRGRYLDASSPRIDPLREDGHLKLVSRSVLDSDFERPWNARSSVAATSRMLLLLGFSEQREKHPSDDEPMLVSLSFGRSIRSTRRERVSPSIVR